MREKEEFPALKPERKTRAEPFCTNYQALGFTLLDFWQWSGSGLAGNTARGILAEFIVASALGLTSGVCNDWEECDLRLPSGLRIEVKSAAYLQTWRQNAYSRITFSIHPSRAWDPKTGIMDTTAKRHSDLYVFCLLAHKEKATLNPLDLDQWEFYILPTRELDTHHPTGKTLSFSGLLKLEPRKVSYPELPAHIAAYEKEDASTK